LARAFFDWVVLATIRAIPHVAANLSYYSELLEETVWELLEKTVWVEVPPNLR
tara:strand:+ start:133 stop:291 length:159 start_codon:yes stop_codon:yes gene_type:complete